MYLPQGIGRMSHNWRGSQVVACLVGLTLSAWLSVCPAIAAPVTPEVAEELIIAVDVSRSMRRKLPQVKRAIATLVAGLDTHRRYRVALVRFGTTVEQVVELDLDGEVARGV